MAKYEIRKGVPLPAKKGGGQSEVYPWKAMVVGDSIVIPAGTLGKAGTLLQQRIAAKAAGGGKRYGKKFATRLLPDGSVGVWCVDVLPSHTPVSKSPKSMPRARLAASLAQPVEA